MAENIQNQNAANAAQAAANAAANANTNVQQPAPAPQQKQGSSHLGWWVAGGFVLAIGVTAAVSYRKGKAAGREEERFRREADADAVAGAISAGLSAGERYSSERSNTETRGVSANRR